MAKEHILVVDDEEDILELIKYNLLKEGYAVITAPSGEKALEIAFKTKIDIIVLDLMLTGIDGLEVTRQLKDNVKTRSIPIIMLSAKSEESDIVTGLELRADDYVTKPFSPRVLIARIRAVLRRKNEEAPAVLEEKELRVGDLCIHPGMHTVTIHDKVIDLTYTEFQLLLLLAKNPGWVQKRSQIVDRIRGDDHAVTDRSVDVQVVGLRKKLGEYADCIETVRGVGYRFKKKV